MEYLYIKSTLFPPVGLSKIELTNTSYPKKELEGRQQVTYQGRKYELLGVYQEGFNSKIKRVFSFIKAIYDLTLSFFKTENKEGEKEKALNFFKYVISGKKTVVIYKEETLGNNQNGNRPSPTTNPAAPGEPKPQETPPRPNPAVPETPLRPNRRARRKTNLEPIPEEVLASPTTSSSSRSSSAALRDRLNAADLRTQNLEIGDVKAQLTQISSLNQNFESGGSQRCGYHAFKNLLATIGLLSDKLDPKIFESKAFYQTVRKLIDRYQPSNLGSNQQDASIAILAQVWNDLVNKEEIPLRHDRNRFSADEKRLLEMLRDIAGSFKDSISMFNYHDIETFKNGIVQVGGLTTGGKFISNFGDLVKSITSDLDKPLKHIFLMGSRGHWTTIVFERVPRGENQWYGLDSQDARSTALNQNVEALIESMDFRKSEQFLGEAYNNNL